MTTITKPVSLSGIHRTPSYDARNSNYVACSLSLCSARLSVDYITINQLFFNLKSLSHFEYLQCTDTFVYGNNIDEIPYKNLLLCIGFFFPLSFFLKYSMPQFFRQMSLRYLYNVKQACQAAEKPLVAYSTGTGFSSIDRCHQSNFCFCLSVTTKERKQGCNACLASWQNTIRKCKINRLRIMINYIMSVVFGK